MSINDVYQVNCHQTLGGAENSLNVFFYQQETAPGDAGDLAAEVYTTLMPAIQAIQSDGLSWNAIEVINLFDELDVFEIPLAAETGDLSGDRHPNFVALSFKLARSTRQTRHGWKRIGGVLESWTNANTLDSTYDSNVAAAALAMFNVLAGVEGSYKPVIVGRISYVTAGGNTAYRLPTSLAEATINPVSAVTFEHVTSQNTRKIF